MGVGVSVSQVHHYLGEHVRYYSSFYVMVDQGCGLGVAGMNGLVGGGDHGCWVCGGCGFGV